MTTLKNSIHRLAPKMTTVDSLYYTIGDRNNTSQIVFYIINDKRDGVDTGNEYRTSMVQFNCFSKELDNGEAVDNMVTELQTVFTKDNLQMSGSLSGSQSQIVSIHEDFIVPSRLIETVWQATIQYSVHIKKV